MNNTSIQFIIFIILIILLGYYYKSLNLNENWVDYKMNYGLVDSGSDPIGFYRRDIYREPYRYPFTFYKSYPYPHQSPFEFM